ncbi:Cytochrome P450 [Dillenia turbinata]|uniref:Cytochrome P450 n=1 Tax=Dillenia turbinata TaxID=194707 RepID=A0AAN8ZD45_9MAGN
MEGIAVDFFWLQSLFTSFNILFFSFTLVFSTLSLLLFLYGRLLKPCCQCEVCQTYLSSSWSKEFNNLCDWYTHLLRESPTQTIRVHVLRNIITANPKNVEHIVKTNFKNYPKGKPFSAILGDLLGKGIFNVDGEDWKFQRKMASLALGSVSIRNYAFEIVTCEIRDRLVPLLSSLVSQGVQKGAVLDLQDVFRRFSFDTICKFSFGLDPRCLELSLPMSEFATAFDVASRLSAERALSPSALIWKIKRFLNLGTERVLKQAINLVNVLAEDVIKSKRKKGDLSTQKDLLAMFMQTIDDHNYLRDIVVSFLLAGRDTVASGLTSFFWLLANHPHVVSAIREESDKIMGPTSDDELATNEQMRKMQYLQAAIYESMRLFPPVQFDSRFSQTSDVLPDGTYVERGTRVTYHAYAMGRMEHTWGSDCLEFKPERWLKDGVFAPEDPIKYPVFHAGLRVCLGKEMALVEMKTVALSLIRKFEFQVASPDNWPRFTPGLTATLRGGLTVVVKRRN